MKSEDWFPTRIWFDDLQLDLNKLKYACLDLEREDPAGVAKSNRGGWQSQDNLSNVDRSLKDLFETIEKVANESSIREEMGCTGKFRLDNKWVNISRQGDYNMPHSHPNSALSACIYISCEDSQSQICFQSPKVHQPSYDSGPDWDDVYLNHDTVRYDPIPSRILFFPSWLQHYVEPNNCYAPRISIAMNFVVEYL
jgi:uncharacterized protein (TIGR02466 family)